MPRRSTPKADLPGPSLFDLPAEGPPPAPVQPEAAPAEHPRFTVGELTQEIKSRLGGLGKVRVEGELSSWKVAASGHVYFDLKEESARLSCVIWRSGRSRALSFDPEEGMQVVAHGRLDVYAPRGSYNLIVERLEPLGLGALLAQLEKLKAELSQKGWFDRARPLPAMPRCIGLVTSRDGAALRDFLRTRSLRWPHYPLRLCHVPVQGPGAAEAIAAGMARLERSGCDVIAVIRGGGSIEDLWAFNERAVAEAIWASGVAVVSGVGHETDTTLADLVADHRAHTPTDAAQYLIPDRSSLVERLERAGNYLIEAVHGHLDARRERLADLSARRSLRDPAWLLGERSRELTALRRALRQASQSLHAGFLRRLERSAGALELASPARRLERHRATLDHAGRILVREGERSLASAGERLVHQTRRLEGVSPLAVLGRGYSVTRKRGEKGAVRAAATLRPGDEVETRLSEGSFLARVLEVDAPDEGPSDV